MIPSDHFVRFYNEVFKFLDEKGGLQKYYQHISDHQVMHCLKLFKEKGLAGVYEYYMKIYKEENCEGETILNEHELIISMTKCPSLSKAINNDAGPCKKYCLHCPGWTMPLYQKAGLFQVYDLMGLDNPQCIEYIYDNREQAMAKYEDLVKKQGNANIMKNFD